MTDDKIKAMDRGDVWNAAWELPNIYDRIRLISRWENATGRLYYEGEPSKENKLHMRIMQVMKGEM